jgi:hypothetical protein
MSIDDPTGGGLDILGAGKALAQLIKSSEKFIDRLYGPWLDVKGQELADRARLKQRMNLAAVANQAEDLVGDLPLHEVPSRTLTPLVLGAANEDHPELQQRWAAMMAQAATSPNELTVPPSFPDVLKHLTALHVQVLDWMYERYIQAPDWPAVSSGDIRRTFNLPEDDYNFIASDLHRLQLIDGRRGIENFSDYEDRSQPIVTTESTYETIRLTPYGRRFIRACNPPVKSK